jgi:hypothetical protein
VKNLQVAKKPEEPTSAWSWANIVKYLTQGFDVGQKIMKILPFLSTGGFAKGSTGVSANNGWIGMVKPSIMRASPPPDISRTGDIYTITHRGQLSTLCKNCDGATAMRGECLFDIDITPTIESWLQRMSAFEKYSFTDIAVTYIPNVPTTVGAKILGFFQWDVDAPLNYGQGEETIKVAMAHQSAAMVDVWTSHTWLFSSAGERKDWWYVDGAGHEPRLTRQGTFSIIAATDMDDANLPTTFGDLIVSYRCKFMVPELGSSQTGEFASYKGVSGWTNAHPLGTSIEPYLTYDTSVKPSYDVADNVTMRYYVPSSGTYSGFGVCQLPAGYWIVLYRIGATTAISGVDLHVFGGYEFLQDAETGGVDRDVHVTSTVACCGYAMIKSLGLTQDDTMGFYIDVDSSTGLNYGEVTVAYMNGSIPYMSPAMLAVEKLSAEIAQLKKAQDHTKAPSSVSTSTTRTRVVLKE